jgi:dienelactone hydrolase
MKTIDILYKHDHKTFYGFCAYDENLTHKRPAVIIAPDWSGQNNFSREKALAFAEMGYVGFALDLYGDKREGKTNEEKKALMTPLMENRTLLTERMLVAFHAVHAMPEVDPNKVAAMGFCFGGLGVLDLARTGEKLAAAITFHGYLHSDPLFLTKKIQAKILVLHGYADPMVSQQHVHDFAEEMTFGEADWQIHVYGNTMHAFTNPLMNEPEAGKQYNAVTAQRSWQQAIDFLKSVFE